MPMTESSWTSRAMECLYQLADYSYVNMCLTHSSSHRSLYYGGAGIAYAFWKAACHLEDPEWLHHARLWIDNVDAAPEDDRMLRIPEKPNEPIQIQIHDSFFLGNRGVSFTQLLIAHSEDNPMQYERALSAFTAPERERLSKQELFQGIAGRLIGCALLFSETNDERLREHGNSLAKDLISTAQVRGTMDPWRDNHRLGLAHGRGGNLYALLLWSQEARHAPPDWLLESLGKFARSGREQKHGAAWPTDERNERRYMNTWCNGAPGLILLWCLAYRYYGETVFLETARSAAEYCINEPDPLVGNICCGAAGVSYALLSLHAIDSGGPWRNHALRYATLAIKGMMDSHYRLSLYRGLAGIVCLMLDMANPEEALQPVIQA
jgi:lantibiotic modifying enzyme